MLCDAPGKAGPCALPRGSRGALLDSRIDSAALAPALAARPARSVTPTLSVEFDLFGSCRREELRGEHWRVGVDALVARREDRARRDVVGQQFDDQLFTIGREAQDRAHGRRAQRRLEVVEPVERSTSVIAML